MNGLGIAALIAGVMVPASGTGNVQANAVATETYKIKHVVLKAGNLGKTLAAGYTTIEQTNVSCGYYGTCRFAMSIMANVGEGTCTGEWAIIGLVDGNSVDGGPLVEALPKAGNTQTHTWQGVYSTGSDYHRITFRLYLPCSANLNQWSVRYLITKP